MTVLDLLAREKMPVTVRQSSSDLVRNLWDKGSVLPGPGGSVVNDRGLYGDMLIDV